MTNKYVTMDRVSEDGNRVVVRVADEQLFKSQYGYGLILDDSHVAWLKDQNVNRNFYGNEVVINKQYFKAKEWGDFSSKFGKSETGAEFTFDHWKKVAQEQAAAGTKVEWENHYHSSKQMAILRNMSKSKK